MAIFEEMNLQGVVPDVITYDALISACEKGEQPERALKNFEDITQRGLELDVLLVDCTIFCHATIFRSRSRVDAICKSKDLEKVW